MLQQDKPEDFVLATGETHPVREFVEKSFSILGMNIKYVVYSAPLVSSRFPTCFLLGGVDLASKKKV